MIDRSIYTPGRFPTIRESDRMDAISLTRRSRNPQILVTACRASGTAEQPRRNYFHEEYVASSVLYWRFFLTLRDRFSRFCNVSPAPLARIVHLSRVLCFGANIFFSLFLSLDDGFIVSQLCTRH